MKKNGKYCNKKSLNMKPLAILLALTLLLGCAIGGTIAWLTSQSGEVMNTFTDSDINITLTESENLNLKMIPGHTITKDPKVTLKAGSEACYVFVQVTENLGSWDDNKIGENNPKFTDYLSYTMGTDWSTDDDLPAGVYYKKVESLTTADTEYVVIKDNNITVSGQVTKEMMDEIDGKNADGTTNSSEVKPTLTFKAYAVQLYKSNGVEFTAAEAWANVSGT